MGWHEIVRNAACGTSGVSTRATEELPSANCRRARKRFYVATSSRFAPSSLRRKNIPVLDHPKSPLKFPPSRSARGALAIVTNVGAGCGGRGSVGREACSQGELNLMSKHGAQTTGAEAYGKTVWSRHPWLVPSCRWRVRSNRIGGPSSRQRRRQDEFVSGESAA
jgi:hypothetical protein